jgi:acetyl-CoA synthetase
VCRNSCRTRQHLPLGQVVVIVDIVSAFFWLKVTEDAEILRLSKSLADETSFVAACQLAKNNPDRFWGALARSYLSWEKPFSSTYTPGDTNGRGCLWFKGGTLNLTQNCLDRHCTAGRGQQRALIWEGDDGCVRIYSYADLLDEVCRASDALRRIGIYEGHVVAVYMPLLPEAIIAILACNRIGAIPCPVYSGLSSRALALRLNQAEAQLLISANGVRRNNKVINLRHKVLKAKHILGNPIRVVEVQRIRGEIFHEDGWEDWDNWIYGASSNFMPVPLDAGSASFIIHTSGTTGKPKQVRHELAGSLLACHITTRWCFDAKIADVLWCTADIGWITSMAHVIYGPLSNGMTTVLFEGSVSNPARFTVWRMIENYHVNKLKTAPTALRALRRDSESPRHYFNLESLDLVFSSGEPLDQKTRTWIESNILDHAGSVVDGWGQTETCSTMICSIPGSKFTPTGSVGRPLPGAQFQIAPSDPPSAAFKTEGFLQIIGPWPGLWADKGCVSKQMAMATGDIARREKDGSFTIVGRHDDVVNVSGHRISTAEVEQAIKRHQGISEVAAVGRPHDLKGQVIAAFVTLSKSSEDPNSIEHQVHQMVAEELGSYAAPTDIFVVSELPRTHSGKIAKGYLMKLAAQEHLNSKLDTSMIQNKDVIADLEKEALLRDNY